MHAWEEWGERCVERLGGMFAFAIWDRNREMLAFYRERLEAAITELEGALS